MEICEGEMGEIERHGDSAGWSALVSGLSSGQDWLGHRGSSALLSHYLQLNSQTWRRVAVAKRGKDKLPRQNVTKI